MSDITNRRPIKARDSQWAHRVTALLIRLRVKPNAISLASVVFSGLAGLALWFTQVTTPTLKCLLYVLAALGIQFRLLCNLFDGMVAVEGGFKSKSGEVFNELPDRFSDASILIGLGYAAHSFRLGPEMGWAAAIIALITAYVRALGAATGAGQNYTGPMAKPHRMATVTTACCFAAVASFWSRDDLLVVAALALLLAGGAITLWRRTRWVIATLESA